jgi:hypothetical protein
MVRGESRIVNRGAGGSARMEDGLRLGRAYSSERGAYPPACKPHGLEAAPAGGWRIESRRRTASTGVLESSGQGEPGKLWPGLLLGKQSGARPDPRLIRVRRT